MNFKIELPEDTFMVTRDDLKEVIKVLMDEIQKDIDNTQIMTIKETSEFLKVSVPTVRKMIDNKEIPFFQRGQVIRLNRSDLKEWLRKEMRKEGVQ
ncbi:helix-turn-helix domain-containing protein [Virgibacillus litoralis]|uniref:helix-turn-helix domain-containing protein n=1 Tax=Virgibacillus litoralis TaxID=578221 RepID=UPI001AEA6D5F